MSDDPVIGHLSLPEAPEASVPRGLDDDDAEHVRKAFDAPLAKSTRRAWATGRGIPLGAR